MPVIAYNPPDIAAAHYYWQSMVTVRDQAMVARTHCATKQDKFDDISRSIVDTRASKLGKAIGASCAGGM
jgi:hypothetical protein